MFASNLFFSRFFSFFFFNFPASAVSAGAELNDGECTDDDNSDDIPERHRAHTFIYDEPLTVSFVLIVASK